MIKVNFIEYSKNPVKVGETFLIKVTVEEVFATWNDLKNKTWNEVKEKTWEDIKLKVF